MSAASWKEKLGDRIPIELGREVDIYETQLELRRQGKIEERLFAETRLRRGVYGQRYDNGQRHDGIATQTLAFPNAALTKGPSTLWDAPGMQRIKIPFGRVTAQQLEVLAELAEEYADAILHVTTRQDFQLHYVHIEDTPDIMRRLAAVGITTREACGNSVRNVTACPYVGVCHDETFDVTPHASALAYFLLGHPDTQDFGRKFKIAFSGCRQHACGLLAMHDLGALAVVRTVDGKAQRGFEVVAGGGLGAVPQQAKLLDPFVPEGELLPLAQALSRVFARLGEKKNRARARLKFLVSRLGVEELGRLVREERAKLPHDPRWSAFLADLNALDEKPLRPPSPLPDVASMPADFRDFVVTNVRPQKQPGYVVVTVTLPLGDLSSDQARALARLSRRHTGDTLRTTVEQNLVLRWVAAGDVPAVHDELRAVGLARAGAGSISDVVACPGTDTCKLGISSSRGLAAELGDRLEKRRLTLHPSVAQLHIKASGCFNACGQHHIADIGLLGVSRTIGSRRVPHFQVVLGGKTTENAGAYGLAIGAIPAKRVPEVVDRLTEAFVRDRTGDESFQAFIQRTGKARIRGMLKDLMEVGSHAEMSELYTDWNDPREYTIGDMGIGECAGEVVPFVQFGLAASEREVFEAQVHLDRGDAERAARMAYGAMLQAALALARSIDPDVADDPDDIVAKFRLHLCDTKLFFDTYAGDKFAQYLLRTHDAAVPDEVAHQRIEEAQLFIDAAHACYGRLSAGTP